MIRNLHMVWKKNCTFSEKEETLYKYDPLYGFVKADDEIKPLEEQEYKYTPYVGFVPATGDEDEDVKTYKFNPFYGFVEKTDEGKSNIQPIYPPNYLEACLDWNLDCLLWYPE